MKKQQIIDWIISRHRDTNHFYDTYLPYEFHLRMVVQVCKDFAHLLPKEIFLDLIELACWGHDLIEDTRTSFNDCANNIHRYSSEIIYAVSNEKGKNRSERANEKYYEGIRNTQGATFVKMCDRIANVQYSKMTKSSMFEKYKQENTLFVEKLYSEDLKEMFDYLNQLFVTD
jgi:hypothetical protein